ncbi:MAG: hypothetical protein R2729_02255 [Bryobacteraceae bacterium]
MKKAMMTAGLAVSILCGVAGAQDPPKPALRKGVSVRMAVAKHAVERRAADEEQAIEVAITADGKLFAGIEPVQAEALGGVRAGTVYVKADARAPFQNVVAVLDALHGRKVVLLTASPANAAPARLTPRYGIELAVSP